MSHRILVRSLLILIACVATPASGRGEVDHTLSLSVVQIRAYGSHGKTFLGSGVVTGTDRVVTNCHVTRLAQKVLIAKGPLAVPAISQQADPQRDICVLTATDLPWPQARLGSADGLTIGQPIYFYGFPLGLGITYSQGHVQALHPYLDGRVIETSADFTLGASGGGLFDGNGQLVGLATFLSPRHAGSYFAVPADWINRVDKTMPQRIEPFTGQGFWENREELPAFLRRPGQ